VIEHNRPRWSTSRWLHCHGMLQSDHQRRSHWRPALTSGACLPAVCGVSDSKCAAANLVGAEQRHQADQERALDADGRVGDDTRGWTVGLGAVSRLVVHRERVMRELLETERLFVIGLHTTYGVLVRALVGWSSKREPPLTAELTLLTHSSARTAAVSAHRVREIADQQSLITHKDLNVIFSKVEVLLPIHEKQQEELVECAATRDEELLHRRVVPLKIIPFVKLHIDHENANHRSTITLNHCMANNRQFEVDSSSA